MKRMFCRVVLIAGLLLAYSTAPAAVDTKIIVFEIAKTADGSVLGWEQYTWSRAEWNSFGYRGVFERLKEKYEAAETHSVSIIPAGYQYAVYTKKHKGGRLTIHIVSTGDREYFEKSQERIEGYVEKNPAQYQILILDGFNKRVEIRVRHAEVPGEIAQLPTILRGAKTREGTFACEGDKGVAQYSVKELAPDVFIIRGQGEGSVEKVDARGWVKSGLSDEKLEKKWKVEASRAMVHVCEGMKRDSSYIKNVTGAMKTYFEENEAEKRKACEEGKLPKEECVFSKFEPASTGPKG